MIFINSIFFRVVLDFSVNVVVASAVAAAKVAGQTAIFVCDAITDRKVHEQFCPPVQISQKEPGIFT